MEGKIRKNKFLADGKQTIKENDEAQFRNCQANSNQLLPSRQAVNVFLDTVNSQCCHRNLKKPVFSSGGKTNQQSRG